MVNPRLEVWQENENGTFYKWPFYNIGVQLKPAAALPDVCAEFGSLLLDKESAGRVLARLIDRGLKSGISVSLYIESVEAALEELPEKHRLVPAVASLTLSNGIRTNGVSTVQYSKSGLRRMFGLS